MIKENHKIELLLLYIFNTRICNDNIGIRDVPSTGFDSRGHVMMGGRGGNFSSLLGVTGVQISFLRERSGTGEIVNKNT
jgi:hypothetical protein